ncbi:spore germination protein [Cohnella cellulosilytica]|uniref:Spore germination protein n=1 Tax=Cohnella cellulosilytica TaxID=986710 RepID=A0ABW2F9Q1_9BACL
MTRLLSGGKGRTPASGSREPAAETKIDGDRLRSMILSSADIVALSQADGHLLIYCSGMIDSRQLNQHVLPSLKILMEKSESADELAESLEETMEWYPLRTNEDAEKHLFNGYLLLYFSDSGRLYAFNISEVPQRQPEESNTEISVKGARDGFTEDIATNVALIRKRLRTNTLHHERMCIGTRSRTEVSLLYMADIIHPDLIREARRRLGKIHVDSLTSSGQLEEGMSDSSAAFFPLIDYIGRPDFAVQCLLRGRFIVLVDGSPMALIAPCNLTELLKTPEDAYLPYHFVAFERILRLAGLLIATLLPGLWIALTSYHVDQLPLPLLATITTSRAGLPFSTPLEMLLMLSMFELFREAGIRLPKAVGQTIAVLGGLIIGDAAIRAGLTSPTTLVASATTAVATFTLVNQSLSGTVSIVRLGILFMSAFLGMFGFFVSVLCLLAYMSVLESFGIPYLAPLSPLSWKELVPGLLAKPWSAVKHRPGFLHTIDDIRREGGDE